MEQRDRVALVQVASKKRGRCRPGAKRIVRPRRGYCHTRRRFHALGMTLEWCSRRSTGSKPRSTAMNEELERQELHPARRRRSGGANPPGPHHRAPGRAIGRDAAREVPLNPLARNISIAFDHLFVLARMLARQEGGEILWQPRHPLGDHCGSLTERLQATRALTRARRAAVRCRRAISRSPSVAAKWHLAHTTWFFETFVLRDHVPDYRLFDERFGYLFNSYYEGEGERHPRPRRGMISRPSLDEVRDWRAHVDAALEQAMPGLAADGLELIELGINHEQQHQELFLTASSRPLPRTAGAGVRTAGDRAMPFRRAASFLPGRTGIVEIASGDGFAFIQSARATPSCSTRTASPAAPDIANGASSSPMAAMRRGAAVAVGRLGLGPAGGHHRGRSIGAEDGSAFRLAGGANRPRGTGRAHRLFRSGRVRAVGRAIDSRPRSSGRASPVGRNPISATSSTAGAVIPQPPGDIFGEVWEWTQSNFSPFPGFAPDGGRGRRL